MILTAEQKQKLARAVDQELENISDPTLITLFRTSNKTLQVFWAFGADAHYIEKLCGMTHARKSEFPWSLGYVSFSSGGYRHLQRQAPIGTQVDIVYF
jgi:hypothetical protein